MLAETVPDAILHIIIM